MDREPEGAVLERSLVDGVAGLPGFELRLFDRVGLEQSVELSAIAPATFVVVEGDLPGSEITDDRLPPVGEPDGVAGRFAGKQFHGLMNGCREV